MATSPQHLPWAVEHLTQDWHRRHPRAVVITESFVAGWLVVLGILLCSIGDWLGALLFGAAALLVWFLRVFWRSVRRDG